MRTDASDRARERTILVAVGLCSMLVPLNSTMIAVALPKITRELGASTASSGWLVTGYLITMASLQPVSGKLGDRFGRRPFILGGLVAFGLTSVAAAVSRDIVLVIAFRCGQAVAGAIAFPNGAALIREVVPARRRASSFGIVGSAIGIGAAAGPSLGGVLVAAGGWPAIFWVNVPLVATVLLLALRTVPPAIRRDAAGRFDLPGACMLSVLLAGGAWLLMGRGRGALGLPAGVVLAVVLVAFVRRERRHADPVVQLRFFTRRAFAAATASVALSNLSMYSVLVAVPLLLESRPGWPESRVGLLLTGMSAGMIVLAPLGGRMADRIGRRPPAAAGMTLLTGALFVLAVNGRNVSAAMLVAVLLLVGVALGVSNPSINTAAVETIDAEHSGMAAAAFSTSRYIGSIVGTSVLAGLATSQSGIGTMFWLCAATALGAALCTLLLPRGRP